MAYGIPSDQVPIKSSGIIKCADHKKFIAYCQAREDAMLRNGENFNVIFCPSSNDVLIGRGPRIKSHIGNEVYRNLLQSKYEEYNSASMTKKKEISFDIIRKVHAYGGRFLIPTSIGWVQTDDETARSKVSIAFRDVRKTINVTMNHKYSNSVASGISVHAQMNFFGCVWKQQRSIDASPLVPKFYREMLRNASTFFIFSNKCYEYNHDNLPHQVLIADFYCRLHIATTQPNLHNYFS